MKCISPSLAKQEYQIVAGWEDSCRLDRKKATSVKVKHKTFPKQFVFLHVVFLFGWFISFHFYLNKKCLIKILAQKMAELNYKEKGEEDLPHH